MPNTGKCLASVKRGKIFNQHKAREMGSGKCGESAASGKRGKTRNCVPEHAAFLRQGTRMF